MNPFDDETRTFHVLTNNEGQHSLWPNTIAVPAGWSIVLADHDRAACLEYVERDWTDLRPASLVALTDGEGGAA